MVNSRISFFYAIGVLGLTVLAIILFLLFDAVFMFLALIVLSPFISLIGLVFALIGIKEQDTFMKWFGFIINLLFSLIGLMMILCST